MIHDQRLDLGRSIGGLEREGLRIVHVMKTPEQVDAATVRRTRLRTNLKAETGPFDIVGDVHGCLDELVELCGEPGYAVARDGDRWDVRHPDGRRLVFVGDLVDRGPDSPGVVHLVRSVVRSGVGFCVAGNHDVKLATALRGRAVEVAHGLERSLEQLHDADTATREEIAAFLDGLVGHYVMDEGRLVVAHAGLVEALHGRSSGRARAFALYGETTGGDRRVRIAGPLRMGARVPRAGDGRVRAYARRRGRMARQHDLPRHRLRFGGRLTALRYPERALVSVPAHRAYYAPLRPLAAPSPTGAQHAADDRSVEVNGRSSDRCENPFRVSSDGPRRPSPLWSRARSHDPTARRTDAAPASNELSPTAATSMTKNNGDH